MASVTFKGVSKQFGEVRAVDDVSLTIGEGEFVCLLGPSGCGKTTTLRLIAGLEQPSHGTIHLGERDVTHAPPKGRDVGMVFQDYALYPHMTIAENIAYPLKVRNVGKRERQTRAEEVAHSLQIGDLLTRRPGQVSGGQQQRTSVARAVVHKPQVFLFDEPLSNLDAKLRLEARSFLKHLQKQLAVTAVYVTHDQAEAMALADRIALMQQGKVVQFASPLTVYRHPATTFVASFLGNPPMNLLPVVLEPHQGEPTLAGGSFRVTLNEQQQRRTRHLAPGTRLTLGVRPEHLTLTVDPLMGVLEGELYAVEPLGPESLVSLSLDDHLVTLRTFQDDPPDVRGRVRFGFDPAHMHLFGEGGERLDDEGRDDKGGDDDAHL